jgi:hypothetical protein
MMDFSPVNKKIEQQFFGDGLDACKFMHDKIIFAKILKLFCSSVSVFFLKKGGADGNRRVGRRKGQ